MFLEILSVFHKRIATSSVGKNTLYSFIGLVARFLLRALYFVIIARTLGVADFGVFSGVSGLVYVFYPFVDLGRGLLMVRAVSRQTQSFAQMWGLALTTIFVMGLFLCVVSVLVAWSILSPRIALFVVLPTAIGIFLGFRVTELAGQAFQAHQQMQRTSAIWLVMGIWRFLAALLFVVMPSPRNVERWAVFFMVSEILGGLLTILWVRQKLGGWMLGLKGFRGEVLDGLTFSISVSAAGAYNDLDKTLLVRLGDQAVAGAYSAAYRFLDAIYIPIQAIVTSTFPKFFQVGERGILELWYYTRQLLPYAVITAVLSWGFMAVVSPFIPKVLGEEYVLTPMIGVWLGPVLIFRSVHNLFANCLSGLNRQGIRSIIQVCVALLNVALNVWWIPRYGWLGALGSSILSDGALVIFLWIAILLLKKQAQ